MSSITEYMTDDHRRCDEMFTETETAASIGDWTAAESHWATFHSSIEQHLGKEEEVLFPAFEQATGNTAGPTAVMKMEHQQMRQLFEQIHQSLQGKDEETLLGLTETLMILMQQHNMKEEQILYPMSQQMLPNPANTLAAIQAC
ncbi:MAG: hemerythrin domain-containing protein [Halopseudomonas sp.]